MQLVVIFAKVLKMAVLLARQETETVILTRPRQKPFEKRDPSLPRGLKCRIEGQAGEGCCKSPKERELRPAREPDW